MMRAPVSRLSFLMMTSLPVWFPFGRHVTWPTCLPSWLDRWEDRAWKTSDDSSADDLMTAVIWCLCLWIHGQILRDVESAHPMHAMVPNWNCYRLLGYRLIDIELKGEFEVRSWRVRQARLSRTPRETGSDRASEQRHLKKKRLKMKKAVPSILHIWYSPMLSRGIRYHHNNNHCINL